MMLDGGCDDVVSGFHDPKECEIIGLCTTACEHDLGSTTSQQLGDRLASPLDRRPRVLSVVVDRRSVPELLQEVRGVVALLSR